LGYEALPVGFFTAGPVVGEFFFDRERELAELLDAVRDLKRGVRHYYALIGQRKIGKTSILRELERRLRREEGLVGSFLDCVGV